MKRSLAEISSIEKKYMLPTYKRRKLALRRARGAYVWDEKGRKYLDFFAGISVSNLGHCHPRIVAAVKRQAAELIHVSNHYYAESPVLLARELVTSAFPGQVFLSNSGAEANECAIKIARKWGKRGGRNRCEVISFTDSFHGRTLATLSATGQMKFHQGFEPLVERFRFATFNDLLSVKRFVNARTAAVIVEPVQGEGGVRPATREFMRGLRDLCDRKGLLLIFDEIQTGMGRTGRLFAYEHFDVVPDVMTLAKSIAGGLPLGATIAGKRAAGMLSYGEHGSTFGGNPVACAAARATLALLTPELLEKVRLNGAYFTERLRELRVKFPCITDVRGLGLMVGIQLDFAGEDIVQWCQEKGLIINCTQGTTLRFLPPLIVGSGEIDRTIRILEDAFTWQTSRR